jgi:hypothetical protein
VSESGLGGPLLTNLWLDAADTIIEVDEEWLEFARANDAPELTRRMVVGRPLRDFIDGPEVVVFTDLLTAAARRKGVALAVPFRCDSARLRRFMTMTLEAGAGGILHLEYRVDRTEAREEEPLFDRAAPRSEELVYLCSWCRRVRSDETWRDVEDGIALGDLFGRGEAMPKLSHGICGDCATALRGRTTH